MLYGEYFRERDGFGAFARIVGGDLSQRGGHGCSGVSVVYGHIGDGVLTTLNQALKLAAIFAGTWAAVGPGGNRGFALGAAIGLVYIALGYGICALWDGTAFDGWMLAVEFLMGALLGGVSGAFIANLPGGKGRARGKAARA